jgi:hypothetical protein
VTYKPQYLRIRNWERFQHYKDRRPPWVKYHVELLDDYELLHLPVESQLVFDRLLLLAAMTDNNVPHDPNWIAGKTNLERDVVQNAVVTLIDAGFLSVAESKRAASKVIARRKAQAIGVLPLARSQEAEAEAEADSSSKEDGRRSTPPDDEHHSVRIQAKASLLGFTARQAEEAGRDPDPERVLAWFEYAESLGDRLERPAGFVVARIREGVRAPAASKRFPCPVCLIPLPSQGRVAEHLRNIHDVKDAA